jgi:tRNA/rRNA methyltransferase
MRNFNLSEMVLVDPQADPVDAEARKLSTQGEEILHQARVVGELAEALSDCGMVVATSARLGGLFRKQAVGPPDMIVHHLVDACASGPAALVFGPEATGLSNEEVSRCNYLIHIPTSPEYPALNLAQAVAICLYEVRRAWLRKSEPIAKPQASAPFVDQERMYDHLRIALQEIHFLYGPKADSLFYGLRHLIGRAQPTEMEIDLLLGLARQLRWYVSQNGPKEKRS